MLMGRRTLLVLMSALLCGTLHSEAAEIGFDLGVDAQLDRDHEIVTAFPSYAHASQVIRIGLPLSNYDLLEVSPGFTLSGTDSALTSSSIELGMSYLRGRVAGGHPSPYLKVGGRWHRESFNVEPYDFSASQVSLLGGGGLKWRVGKVLAVRSEGAIERLFTSRGFSAGWNLALMAGISVFTN